MQLAHVIRSDNKIKHAIYLEERWGNPNLHKILNVLS